jgi:hypothetical protein
VLQQLPCKVLVSVKELARRVRTGAVDDPYEQLEAKLTASYQKSPWQKMFELLDMPDLGDRRPSALLDTMLALLPEDVPPNRLFLALFLHRLPEDMRNHLAAQEAMAAAANRPPWPPGPIRQTAAAPRAAKGETAAAERHQAARAVSWPPTGCVFTTTVLEQEQ